MTNKEMFEKVYAEAFHKTYPHMPADYAELVKKTTKIALDNIDNVRIEGVPFKLTSKKLGINHSKAAIRDFINA